MSDRDRESHTNGASQGPAPTHGAAGKSTLVAKRYGSLQLRRSSGADAPSRGGDGAGPASPSSLGPTDRALEDDPGVAPAGEAPATTAARGLDGAGHALPHGAAIQRAFGRHQIGAITAHTDPEAAQAARALGADGFAFGDHVAFAEPTPGLHLAAHEAAHVIQQRGDVQRKPTDGGVDSSHEAHANQVADRVVAGESAERLLDQVAPDAAVAPPRAPAVQRFATDEHAALGDSATRAGTKEGVGADGIRRGAGGYMWVRLAPDVWVTYGQMCAMAGDYFRDIWEMRELAARKGTGPGTREELNYVYAVYITRTASKKNFNQATVDHREAKMIELLGSNRAHFLHPDENDRSQTLPQKASEMMGRTALGKGGDLFANFATQTDRGGPGASAANAFAGFRMAHVVALREAYEEGRRGNDIFSALASEAFAGHFLTDAFAGGHVRVARDDIAEHWNPRVPMFPRNASGWLAEHLAKQTTSVGVDQLFHQIRAKTDAALGAMPFGFGDMMSNVMHNLDNARGVKTNIDGKAVTLKGDHHLSESPETKAAATRAIQQAIAEVKYAWDVGRVKGSDPATIERAVFDAGTGTFSCERLLPQVLPNAQQGELREVDWHGNDAEALVRNPALPGAIRESFAEIAPTLKDNVTGIPLIAPAMDRLVAAIGRDPVGTMTGMIHWTPSTGGGPGGHNTDDNAVDYVNLAKGTAGGMRSLTRPQRGRLLRDLLDGYVDGEELQAMEVLKSASPADARWLISDIGYKYLADKIDGWGITGNSPFSKFAASLGIRG